MCRSRHPERCASSGTETKMKAHTTACTEVETNRHQCKNWGLLGCFRGGHWFKGYVATLHCGVCRVFSCHPGDNLLFLRISNYWVISASLLQLGFSLLRSGTFYYEIITLSLLYITAPLLLMNILLPQYYYYIAMALLQIGFSWWLLSFTANYYQDITTYFYISTTSLQVYYFNITTS